MDAVIIYIKTCIQEIGMVTTDIGPARPIFLDSK